MTSKEYRTITQIAGPLVFVEKTEPVGYNEIAVVTLPNGEERRGQVLDSSHDIVVIQMFEGRRLPASSIRRRPANWPKPWLGCSPRSKKRLLSGGRLR